MTEVILTVKSTNLSHLSQRLGYVLQVNDPVCPEEGGIFNITVTICSYHIGSKLTLQRICPSHSDHDAFFFFIHQDAGY
jgi:hypothetical protein